MFVALDEEESFSYFLLAALYGIPFLTEGFSLGSLSWFMLVAGAVHLQVAYFFREALVFTRVSTSANSLNITALL